MPTGRRIRADRTDLCTVGRDAGAFRLTDDAAVLSPRPDHDLVVTTDALVEGVHFLSGDPPGSIAKKALRANLSDLAAKGAEPAGYLLALSLPARIDMTWIEAFARGLGEDQKSFTVPLLGGDTTATPGPLTMAVTALGHVPAGAMIRRAGCKGGRRRLCQRHHRRRRRRLALLKGGVRTSAEATPDC